MLRWILVFSLLLASPATAATVNQTGYWTFDEAAGGTAVDSVGGRVATLSGGAAWGPGFKGYALVLNGTSAYADVATPVVDTTRSYSVSVRARFSRLGGYQNLVGVDGTRVSGFYIQVREIDGNRFGYTRQGTDETSGPYAQATSSTVAVADRWYMLTIVYDTVTNTQSLYVDNRLENTVPAVPAWRASGHMTIGRSIWGSFADYVAGSIDEVRTFDGALTPTQVAELYATGSFNVIVDDDRDNVAPPLDCNDANGSIHPGAVDVPGDGIDQDCSGADALVDADGDGFVVGADCNDGSAAINRNAAEIAGNGVDENCDGVAAIAPMTATVRSDWAAKRTTRVNTLLVRNAPANANVELRCRGGGCPFKSRVLAAPKGGNVNLRALLRKARLKPRAVVEVYVSAPFTVAKVARFTIRRERTPLTAYLCLPPGAAKPAKCV